MSLCDFYAKQAKHRTAWIVLFLCIIFFESCALFFQYYLELQPCVMCIYERMAMMGVGLSSLVALINPSHFLFRTAGVAGWIYSSLKGLYLAMAHTNLQLHPSPFNTCDVFVKTPSWLPLNKWAPWMFEAYGDCSKVVWTFLSFSMPQWLIFIFAGILAIGIMVALSLLNEFSQKKSSSTES